MYHLQSSPFHLSILTFENQGEKVEMTHSAQDMYMMTLANLLNYMK